jgi:hypothetical protein
MERIFSVNQFSKVTKSAIRLMILQQLSEKNGGFLKELN